MDNNPKQIIVNIKLRILVLILVVKSNENKIAYGKTSAFNKPNVILG